MLFQSFFYNIFESITETVIKRIWPPWSKNDLFIILMWNIFEKITRAWFLFDFQNFGIKILVWKLAVTIFLNGTSCGGFNPLKPLKITQKILNLNFLAIFGPLPHTKISIYFFLNRICFSKVFLYKNFENITETELRRIFFFDF